nr:MAG TPA: hypothetical protein [Caudoviricetes sp.]
MSKCHSYFLALKSFLPSVYTSIPRHLLEYPK